MADASATRSPRLLPSRPVKRSFSLAGHRTSISLEAAFWDALREVAACERVSLAVLVDRIDRARGDAGLSGAVRVWVLDYFRARSGKGEVPDIPASDGNDGPTGR